jgi:gag-polypeptide of LTR copia-type
VWAKLRDMYEPESLARSVELYNQLIAMQQQPREAIAEYFERAQHLRNQLISAGGHMNEHAFAMALINGLREEFEIAITMLTTPHTAKQLTAELIRPGLLAYKARMASRHSMQRERSEAMAYAAGGKSYGVVSSRPAAMHNRPRGGAWQHAAPRWAAYQPAAQRQKGDAYLPQMRQERAPGQRLHATQRASSRPAHSDIQPDSRRDADRRPSSKGDGSSCSHRQQVRRLDRGQRRHTPRHW